MTSCTCEPSPSIAIAPPTEKSHVDSIRELLNGPALLLHCIWGEKACYENWKSYALDRMEDPKYLARLRSGNIGVALGNVSAGLFTIDVDVEGDVEAFLALNPNFKTTLMTRGRRGCNIWLRIRRGKCPPSRVLKRSRKKWGEVRSTGNQTIIYGKHPDGMRYSYPQRFQVVEIDSFDEVKWLPGMEFSRGKVRTETDASDTLQAVHAVDAVHATNAADVADAAHASDGAKVINTASLPSSPSSLPPFPAEKVSESLPTQPETNHHLLFQLAREVFTFEKQHGGKYSSGDLGGIFNGWYVAADKQFLRDSKADYFTEFLNAYKNVKVAIGEEVFSRAWANAQKATAAPEVMAVFGEFAEIQKLACLCRELQREFGTDPFFLSCRTVGELFHISPKTAWKRLICLERCGFLKTVEKGGPTTNLASRFKYLLSVN
jgi:hypothetical protein